MGNRSENHPLANQSYLLNKQQWLSVADPPKGLPAVPPSELLAARLSVRPAKPKRPSECPRSGRSSRSGTEPVKGLSVGSPKKDLMKSKSGKIVSKKQALRAKGNMKKNGLGKWMAAVKQVRKEMGLKGFVAIKKGTPYYKRVRAVYEA